jgi:hypothetical protein
LALTDYARDAGLVKEYDELRNAYDESIKGMGPPVTSSEPGAIHSLKQWRLMAAARIALLYYPERVAAIEQALGPALELVDTVLRNADETQKLQYAALDYDIDVLGERRALEELKKVGRDQSK